MSIASPDQNGGPARNAATTHAAALVERKLAEWGDIAGSGSVLNLAHTTRSHGGGFLFRVAPRRGGPALAAKLFRERSNAAAEFRMAREVEGLSSRVVRALRCDEDLGLFVGEWLEGEMLSEMWQRGSVSGLAAQAGQWLRRYHIDARLPGRPVQSGASLAEIVLKGRRTPASMDPEEQREFAHVTRALASQAHRVLEPLMPVRLHGDFNPKNLIVTPGGLVAVDLIHARPGSRFEDLARMTVWLAMTAETEAPGFDGELARAAFLEGYGLRSGGAERRLLVAEGLELLWRWYKATRPARPAPRRARTARALLRRAGWLDG